jgi:hypothetical protein
MYDRRGMIDLIEDAESHTPFCTCGEPMVPAVRDGALWLECSARRGPHRGLLARLISFDWAVGHDRNLLLDSDELAGDLAAA